MATLPGVPRTWVAGDVLTAAQLNAELRDSLTYLNNAFPLGIGAWTTYTPTLTQSVTVPRTVTRAAYTRVGRLVTVHIHLAITGAGTSGQAIQVDIPVASVNNGPAVGAFYYFDAGSTIYSGTALGSSATAVRFFVSGNGNPMGVNPTFGAASGDVLVTTLTYEAAS